MSSLQETPRGSRLHIGLFGRRNSGKSSLLNALLGQSLAVVSDVPGTTTDPVEKAMELHGLGPVLFIDTAGFDDDAAGIGALRLAKTARAAKESDIALLLFPPEAAEDALELAWYQKLKKMGRPVLAIVSKADTLRDAGAARAAEVAAELRAADPAETAGATQGGRHREIAAETPVLRVSAREKSGLTELRREIARLLPADAGERTITGNLVSAGDVILLVMPQDREAPQGRLILPQVQTIRELLDKHTTVVACQTDDMAQTLARLKEPPHLIITDSQAFRAVHALAPKESRVTSFSVLFAAQKGDIAYFLAGAKHLLAMEPGAAAKILIAEACTHHPIAEDIGRVKIPRLLQKRLGEQIQISVVSGKDFPQDLAPYDLIIHCGSCMFNRSYVLCRVAEARAANVPMTNYGLAIAALLGILPDVAIPGVAEMNQTTR